MLIHLLTAFLLKTPSNMHLDLIGVPELAQADRTCDLCVWRLRLRRCPSGPCSLAGMPALATHNLTGLALLLILWVLVKADHVVLH